MWIKNNQLLINSNNIVMFNIDAFEGKKIIATDNAGETHVIGRFSTKTKTQKIFSNICQRLLTGDPEDEGIIIVDDKPKEVKKSATRKSNKRSNS